MQWWSKDAWFWFWFWFLIVMYKFWVIRYLHHWTLCRAHECIMEVCMAQGCSVSFIMSGSRKGDWSKSWAIRTDLVRGSEAWPSFSRAVGRLVVCYFNCLVSSVGIPYARSRGLTDTHIALPISRRYAVDVIVAGMLYHAWWRGRFRSWSKEL